MLCFVYLFCSLLFVCFSFVLFIFVFVFVYFWFSNLCSYLLSLFSFLITDIGYYDEMNGNGVGATYGMNGIDMMQMQNAGLYGQQAMSGQHPAHPASVSDDVDQYSVSTSRARVMSEIIVWASPSSSSSSCFEISKQNSSTNAQRCLSLPLSYTKK